MNANSLVRALLLPLILLTTSAAPAGPPPPPPGKIKVGAVAPDFEVRLVDGTKVTLADLRGTVVVLNFWATWCVPCRTELPLLDRYYQVQQPHGLRVFAVTTEDSLPLNKLKPLFAAMAIPAARGIKGPYASMGGVPTNIVIGRDGRIRYAKAGAFTLDQLNELLVPLLKEPGPAS
ncbi:TlpA disulfide reductase family protein [Sphingomonas sp.]|uniref:TlpA family protein disulfide reductase n=1 Tax=Sphingomonas sp. TaxID=28214 RepID=UPI002D0BE636|nr:TlpA disulfide reductase family protein [Sphingomonas sp.]HWK37042.1 TlpA disulfide reductase family protein [Sphingomonas sp.]